MPSAAPGARRPSWSFLAVVLLIGVLLVHHGVSRADGPPQPDPGAAGAGYDAPPARSQSPGHPRGVGDPGRGVGAPP
ncbi:hypothetical protein ACFW9D_34765, partial [Streptomyces sp. NPDC059524]